MWTGIADPDLAVSYLRATEEHGLWSGWGMRTLAPTMDRYDPLSYHNGSVWPHDTALFAAGAARYGQWDVVDRIVEGALETAARFHGRPPELFAGISRDDAAGSGAVSGVLRSAGVVVGVDPSSCPHDDRTRRPRRRQRRGGDATRSRARGLPAWSVVRGLTCRRRPRATVTRARTCELRTGSTRRPTSMLCRDGSIASTAVLGPMGRPAVRVRMVTTVGLGRRRRRGLDGIDELGRLVAHGPNGGIRF